MLMSFALYIVLNSCMVRFSFWKDHLGCSVDGELKIVESRSRNSSRKATVVVQVRDDEGWCGRNCGALPRSPFTKWL